MKDYSYENHHILSCRERSTLTNEGSSPGLKTATSDIA